MLGILQGVLAMSIVGGIGSAITAGFRNIARRFALVSVENLSQLDSRPPILFLRSFQDDQVKLSWERRGRFRNLMAVGEPSPTLDHVLLDEVTPSGPVFAIGVPGRPPPFGAARTYADDREWQDVVTQLSERAKAIVIVVDETSGVKWELDHIRDKGHAAKTLYLLPPRSAAWALSSEIFRREVFEKETADWVADEALLTFLGLQVPQARNTVQNVACIGWYLRPDRTIVALTTATPTKASYVCAIRMFREQQHSHP
jgi:hypothetical protein